jgi:type IV secretion system protein TrbL
MDVNTLTTVLGDFTNVLTQGQSRIIAAGDTILRALALIEIVLACLWVAMDGTKTSDVFRKLLQLTFWLWFAKHFPSLVGFFKDSLISIASAAGGLGGNSSLLYDPSKIAGLGLDATQPLAQAIHDAGWSHFGQSLILVFALIPIVASFFIIACQATLAVIEYHLIVVLGCCLIPFGVSEHTKFISEKAISAAVAVSIKLMVLSLILAILQPVLTTGLHFSGAEFTLNEALAMVLLSTVAAVLCWRVPSMAADLLSGSPSISTAAVAHNVQSGVTAGARMATRAVTYALGAGRNAVAGTSFATRATTGAVTRGASALASVAGRAVRNGPPPGSAPPPAAPAGAPTLPSTVASSSPPATSPPLATGPTSPSSRSA